MFFFKSQEGATVLVLFLLLLLWWLKHHFDGCIKHCLHILQNPTTSVSQQEYMQTVRIKILFVVPAVSLNYIQCTPQTQSVSSAPLPASSFITTSRKLVIMARLTVLQDYNKYLVCSDGYSTRMIYEELFVISKVCKIHTKV